MVMRTPNTYQRYIKLFTIKSALNYNFWHYVTDVLKSEARVRYTDYAGGSCVTYFLHPTLSGRHNEEYHFHNKDTYDKLITWIHRMNNMGR